MNILLTVLFCVIVAGGRTTDPQLLTSNHIVTMKEAKPSVIQCAPIVNISDKDIERFWSKVDKKSPDECWTWTGCFIKKDGVNYRPILNLKKKGSNFTPRFSSRISYLIHNGEVPIDKIVCHTCDNPFCVNPHHLFLGTNDDNSKDMVSKGRQSRGEKHSLSKQGHGKSARGERNQGAKLTTEVVLQIRERYRKGDDSHEMAKEFGMTYVSIWNIVTNRTWKHI